MNQSNTEYSQDELDTRGRGPNRPGIKWIAIVLIALLVVGGLGYRFVQNRKAEQAKKEAAAAASKKEVVQTVNVAAVRIGNVQQTLAVTGSLKAGRDVNLSSKISGRVEQVLVREGSRVRRGQLIVTLDDEDQRSSVQGARAGLQQSQARLAQLQAGLPATIAGINTQIQQAQANLSSMQAKYRQAQLREPVQVQLAATGVEQAQAGLQTALARYQQAQTQQPTRVQNAKSQVNTAQQTIRTTDARLNQARTTAKQTQEQVEAGIARAQAGVEQSKAALADIERGARAQQIAQAQAQVDQVAAQLALARTELERARFLFQNGAGPRSAVDTAQTNYDVTLEQLKAAQQNLSLVKEGATTEAVRQAQEGVRSAQAQLATAEADRSRIPNAQSEITAALAAKAGAQENLRTAQAGLSEINVAAQDVRIAREAVDQARTQLDAARVNKAQVPITRQETRIALQAVQQALAQLAAARANRANIPAARQDIEAAKAAVASSRAMLGQAQITLANTKIYSPVSGVVNKKMTETGQSVAPGTTILNIVALNTVYFEAQVSENNVRLVQEGDTVNVTAPAVSDKSFEGFVSDIIPVADPQSRQFRLRVTVADAPKQLTPGAFARGQVITEAVYNTPVVETDAIRRKDGKTTVLVAPGNDETAKVEKREVKTGLEANNEVRIVSGLEAGDRVIIGEPLLEPGTKVKVAKAEKIVVAQ